MIAHHGANEVRAIRVEAVANPEIHPSEIDEPEVDRELLAIGRASWFEFVNIRHPIFSPSDSMVRSWTVEVLARGLAIGFGAGPQNTSHCAPA
jgi:hypothetical protein